MLRQHEEDALYRIEEVELAKKELMAKEKEFK
jgi:hypothetical protein